MNDWVSWYFIRHMLSGASLLRNMLAVKEVIRAGEGKIRTGQDFQSHLIL